MTLSPLNRNVIDDFQHGHYSVVKELYDEYYAVLIDFATQLVINKAEAHHIVQETFIKLFQMRDRFNTLPDIKAFLYITVRNICFAYIRSERDTEAGSEVTWLERSLMATARFEEGVAREEAICKITKTVNELPEPERTVFSALFYDRLALPAAAELLGLTPVAVTQRRIRAIRILRDRLIAADLFSVPLFIYFVAVFCGAQNN